MIHFKCLFSYEGSRYQGWQIQPGETPTVQKMILEAGKKIFDTDKIQIIGSGRTDTGVHAIGQVVRISMEKEVTMELENIHRGLNSLLPEDISLITIEKCSENFHPVFSALKKQYDYLFFIGHGSRPPHLKKLMAQWTYEFDEKLAREVCALFLGSNDFKNFMNKGTPVNSTVREIFQCNLEFVKPDEFWSQSHSGYWKFSIIGNGFLKQMVRLMVGAMFSVARGKVTMDEFKASLYGENDHKIGPVAPAEGLYLVEVLY